MTFEEEAKFLAEWESKSLAGEVLSIPELKAHLSEKLGRPISKCTLYGSLKRHNWHKVKPDTRPPKNDPIVEEEFKNYRYTWKKFL
jgi:hypothetical protein